MDKLKKGNDVLADEVTSEKGVSQVGIDIRRADKRNPGVVSHGYGRVSTPDAHKEKAKSHLKSLVHAIKTQPKPNLTRSEDLQKDYWSGQIKAAKEQKNADRQAKLETHFKAKGQKVPEHLANPKEQTIDYKQVRSEMQKPKAAVASPTNKPTPVLEAKPNLPRNQKVFNPDLSGKVGYKPTKLAASEKAKIQPASITEPLTINSRETITSPHMINGPVKLNPYGDNMKKASEVLNKMIGCLKKVDPKTKLPGVMIDKSENTKKNMNIMNQASVAKASSAPAPAPALPKPAAPKMQQTKMPKSKAPAIKQPPALQMNEQKPLDSKTKLVNHLKSLKSVPVIKSEETPGKKYVTVSQHWTSRKHNKESGKAENPVWDSGKKKLTHTGDLDKLKSNGHISGWDEHNEPKKMHGYETYEKHPDGKLTFVHAKYDTSG